jgi:Baseplate J-like protein
VISDPVVDGRRVESLVQELRRYAPHYTPDLNLSDDQTVGVALMRIFAQLAETVLVRIDRTPRKHFVAFLNSLGINLLPARSASAAVTFRLASGLEEPVRVPLATRVTATGTEGDIVFETVAELVAIPGVLTTVYSVDPAKDVIFRPPPGFLVQEPRTPTELEYEAQSFAAAGSNRLQLNHVTDLAPQSFIRVGCKEKRVVQKLADGNIITLETPVAAAVTEGTTITPIRDFEVFDGIDLQEHALYVGHPDLFTVKEQAEISLSLQLLEEQSAVEPLDIAWQFWTKVEGPSGSEELWHDLAVESDSTGGLSSSGSVVLTKPGGLEINEREVGGTTSRWIRAQLRDKLPAGNRVLPSIDTIAAAVKTGEPEGIAADQGFHNATPLDVQVEADVGFLPFGTEPRQFDQFYIGSEEAFSKRGATATLKFELDLQTLAGPAVVVAAEGEVLAHSIGLRRTVYELDADTGNWEILGTPAIVGISERPDGSGFLPVEDSVPSTVASGENVYVFVTTEDSLTAENPPNRIWVHHPVDPPNPANPDWKDLGAPGPLPPRIPFSPAAVGLAGTAWPDAHIARVFVVAADGKLYSRVIGAEGKPIANWDSHGTPLGVALDSPAFVTIANDNIFAFVNGGGVVHRFLLRTNLTFEWLSLAQSGAFFTAVSRPFAQPFGAGTEAKVFSFGREQGTESWKLFECDTRSGVGGTFAWVDLGQPTPFPDEDMDVRPEAHAPSGFIEHPDQPTDEEGKHIFLRGSDDLLYERLDGVTATGDPRWKKRSRAADPALRDSPAVLVDPGTPTTIRVISASGRNSLVAWAFEVTDVAAIVNGLGVRLDEDRASAVDNQYAKLDFQITAGTGGGDPANKVEAYDGALRLARLAGALTTLPDDTSVCEIDGEPLGNAREGADRLFAFHPAPADAGPGTALSVRIDGDYVDVDFYSRITGIVSLDPSDVAGALTFVLHAEVTDVTTEYLPLDDRSSVPDLSWEYWNGRGWLSLRVIDGTRDLLSNGDVIFNVPPSIERTEVAGQDNFWIRARLVGGDYGRETFKVVNDVVVSEKSSLRPPKIRQLSILYAAEPVPPVACLTFNNLDYLDQTAAARAPGAHFKPFEPLEDATLTLFLGFDKPFKSGPVRLLLDAAEREFEDGRAPQLDWRFRRDRLWKKLDVDDGSVALTRPGLLTLSASEELTRETRFGESLFWIKGSLRTDLGASQADYPLPLLRGIFLNTVSATQGETITEEIVGSSDGEPSQVFTFQHADVLEGEDIRVRESLSAEERARIERESGTDSVVDREDIGGTWVRWNETSAFFDAGPQDRDYSIDRALGQLQFGDGVHGSIPPAGVDNIRAFSYRAGGGAIGNVAAGRIEALSTAVAGIESVFNPTPAGGGSDKADTEAMLTIGPRRISHRDRAVSAEDFEELAHEASRQVAKVKCLATTNLARRGVGRADPCDPAQRHDAREASGWVSLIIVPDSADPLPCPSLQLRSAVKDYLQQRAPSVLAGGERIVVRPPDYVEVAIEAEIFVVSLDDAAAAETQARTRLDTFLHPLRGGPSGTGWDFGRPIGKSDVFAVLEQIEEVDRVENLLFHFRGGTDADRVVIGPNELLAAGQHRLAVKKA